MLYEEKYLGLPDWKWQQNLSRYLNTTSKDNPLYEKAEKSLAFISNRMALKRKVRIDAEKFCRETLQGIRY